MLAISSAFALLWEETTQRRGIWAVWGELSRNTNISVEGACVGPGDCVCGADN